MYQYTPMACTKAGDIVQLINNECIENIAVDSIHIIFEEGVLGIRCKTINNGTLSVPHKRFNRIATKPGSEAVNGDSVIRVSSHSIGHVYHNIEVANTEIRYRPDYSASKHDFLVLCKQPTRQITDYIIDIQDCGLKGRRQLKQVLELHNQPIYSETAVFDPISYHGYLFYLDKGKSSTLSCWIGGANKLVPNISLSDFLAKFDKPVRLSQPKYAPGSGWFVNEINNDGYCLRPDLTIQETTGYYLGINVGHWETKAEADEAKAQYYKKYSQEKEQPMKESPEQEKSDAKLLSSILEEASAMGSETKVTTAEYICVLADKENNFLDHFYSQSEEHYTSEMELGENTGSKLHVFKYHETIAQNPAKVIKVPRI